jgi:hypothetical protein
LPALLALVGWVFLFCTTEPKLLLGSLVALLLGVASFLAWAWRARRWPFAAVVPGP